MPATMTMTHDARMVMQALQELLQRDYARPVGAEDLRMQSGLEPEALEAAVNELAGGPRPYLTAHYDEEDGRPVLVEVRLTTDGQQFCRVRD